MEMGSSSSTTDKVSSSTESVTKDNNAPLSSTTDDVRIAESSETEEDKWFGRLEQCLQRTDFIERLASCQKGQVPTSTYEEEDYVIVGRDDAIQEMANMIAACIIQCPEARDLSPTELHEAVVNACKDIKKVKTRSYWGWCQFVYKSASWGYAAVQVYANPWVILAVCRAICLFPKTFLKFFL